MIPVSAATFLCVCVCNHLRDSKQERPSRTSTAMRDDNKLFTPLMFDWFVIQQEIIGAESSCYFLSISLLLGLFCMFI